MQGAAGVTSAAFVCLAAGRASRRSRVGDVQRRANRIQGRRHAVPIVRGIVVEELASDQPVANRLDPLVGRNLNRFKGLH